MLNIGDTYSREDIYRIFKVPLEKQKGNWNTGYNAYGDHIFIFSNVGIPGRTGHDYNNFWDGDLFYWEAKNNTHINQSVIRKLLSRANGQRIFLFTRTQERVPFTFEGEVVPETFVDASPVKIVWKLAVYPYESLVEERPSEKHKPLLEGASSQIVINKYERNPLARRMCIEQKGYGCTICAFDFYRKYGPIGKNYIHVHHLIPLAEKNAEYLLNPDTDLIPICPNCHVMIHKRSPIFEPAELKKIISLSPYLS
jgi:5-methylcytosine-specific restriction enzyme A